MQGELEAQIWRYGNTVRRDVRSPLAVMRYLAKIGERPGYQVVFRDPGDNESCLRVTPAQFRALYATGYLKEPVRLDNPEARRMTSAETEHTEPVPEILVTIRAAHGDGQPPPPHPPLARKAAVSKTQRGLSPPRTRRATPGVVYIFHAEGTTRVKIGRSRSLEQRKHAVHTASPFPIRLLREIKTNDAVYLETLLHRRYHDYRRHREWFEIPWATLDALLNEDFAQSL